MRTETDSGPTLTRKGSPTLLAGDVLALVPNVKECGSARRLLALLPLCRVRDRLITVKTETADRCSLAELS